MSIHPGQKFCEITTDQYGLSKMAKVLDKLHNTGIRIDNSYFLWDMSSERFKQKLPHVKIRGWKRVSNYDEATASR